MGRLGLVAAQGRTWRTYAAPVAFLLAATLVVALVRNGMHHDSSAGKVTAGRSPTQHKAASKHKRALYVVRAGDTISAIAVKTGVPAARLLTLNPKISPTALFIGEKIHLR